METELDHGDPCQQDIINEEHDVPGSVSPPAYDEAQCLADSFAEYGNSTLPHSTTTQAEAVALIMSFLTSENLTWSALKKLLRMLIINELPPTVRFDHCALAGLWFGSTHPDMGLFMTKFVEEVTSLDTVTWENDFTVMTSKVHALCCCVDAPARAEVRNHTHFNGYFGCPWCLASGEHLGGSLRYRGAVPDEKRTHEGVLRDMKLALQRGVSVNGVKGPSPLATQPNFDLVWGFNVDYMHCVLLGVARQFTEYLLNSTNCHEDFYIGK
ncbi:hypothetical protein ISCGN_030178 [Ixodes scapularis]